MEIIRLNPVFKQMLWGGNRMRTEFGYDIPGDDTGECWAISAHKNGDCTVDGGEYAGMKLSRLWESHQELFGNAGLKLMKKAGKADDVKTAEENGLPKFPLLTKIIDAKRDLSIQVHPDDEYAMVNEDGSLGKTECWYILDCIPDATIVIGHNARTHEEMEDMIRSGRWKDFLREVPVHKGDFLQINPGTVHSIKAGTLILETQQNSDVTYRVYDYDRLQNGKLRPLHLKQSMDVIEVPFKGSEAEDRGTELTLCNPEQQGTEGAAVCTPLVSCNRYKVWKLDVDTFAAYLQDKDFLLCSVIDGNGAINGSTIRKGDHFIVPAGYGAMNIEGKISMICSTVNY